MRRVVCLLTGNAGTDNQVLGLAEALERARAGRFEVRKVSIRSRAWRLPAALRYTLVKSGKPSAGLILRHAACALAPVCDPERTIIIAAGAPTAPVLLALTEHTGARAIQILDPECGLGRFDLVVLPRHDGFVAPNVYPVFGSLGRVRDIRSAAGPWGDWATPFAALPLDRVAVLIGGPSPDVIWRGRDEQRLLRACTQIVASDRAVILVPSPRTPRSLIETLREFEHSPGIWLWDRTPPNPYPALLASVSAVLVTGDSVNMCSEAASTGLPVHVFDVIYKSIRLKRFHESLRHCGLARSYAGVIEHWTYSPLAEADRLAMDIAANRILRD